MATSPSIFKRGKMASLPKKGMELDLTLGMQTNLTLQITWGGAHLATPLPLCV